MRLYEIFSGKELEIAQKIQRRRYQVLVHSCLYYTLNDSVISDTTWNAWAHELADLQRIYPQIAEKVPLADEFQGFTGSTGMDLPITEPWVIELSKQVSISANLSHLQVTCKLLASQPKLKSPLAKKQVKQRKLI